MCRRCSIVPSSDTTTAWPTRTSIPTCSTRSTPTACSTSPRRPTCSSRRSGCATRWPGSNCSSRVADSAFSSRSPPSSYVRARAERCGNATSGHSCRRCSTGCARPHPWRKTITTASSPLWRTSRCYPRWATEPRRSRDSPRYGTPHSTSDATPATSIATCA